MPLNTEYRIAVRIGNTPTGRYSWIIRNFRVTNGGPDESPSDLVAAFRLHITPKILGVLCPTLRIERYEVFHSFNPQLLLYSLDLVESGTWFRKGYMPDVVCTLIRLTWDLADQRHVGKLYLPYVPIPWDGFELAQLHIRFAELTEKLDVPIDADAEYTPVIWHRKGGTSSVVLESDYEPRYRVQRRRGKTAPALSDPPLYWFAAQFWVRDNI